MCMHQTTSHTSRQGADSNVLSACRSRGNVIESERAVPQRRYAPLSVRLIELSAKQGWASQSAILQMLPRPVIEFVQHAEPEEFAQACANRCLDRACATAILDSRHWPSPACRIVQQGSRTAASSNKTKDAAEQSVRDAAAPKRRIMLVYFIGGITYMEVAALRFLNTQRDCESHLCDHLVVFSGADQNNAPVSLRRAVPFTIVIATTKLINGTTFLKSLLSGASIVGFRIIITSRSRLRAVDPLYVMMHQKLTIGYGHAKGKPQPPVKKCTPRVLSARHRDGAARVCAIWCSCDRPLRRRPPRTAPARRPFPLTIAVVSSSF